MQIDTTTPEGRAFLTMWDHETGYHSIPTTLPKKTKTPAYLGDTEHWSELLDEEATHERRRKACLSPIAKNFNPPNRPPLN